MTGRDERPSGAFLWVVGSALTVAVILLTIGSLWRVLS